MVEVGDPPAPSEPTAVRPLFAGSWSSLSGAPFTLVAGIALAIGLWAVARFASARMATFVVSLLAVQCVLNALLDLKTVFFLSSPFATTVPTDAVNMASATGIPAIIWAVVWIAIAVGILSAGSGTAERRGITEKDLFSFVWVADPQMAPDGSQVVFVRVTADEKKDTYLSSIWIARSDGSEPPRR